MAVSIQSMSMDPARARQSGLRPRFALVELTSAPREAAGLPAAAGGTPSGQVPSGAVLWTLPQAQSFLG